MDVLQTIILSERLILVPLSMEFTHVIFDNFTPEITTYMLPKAPEAIKDTEKFINNAILRMQKNEELSITILHKDTDEFLGGASILNIHTSTPKLGIWIKKSAQGNKYGREAVTALKKWADEHIKYDYIIYPVDRRNISSCKIAESLGGVVKAEYKKENQSGNILDEIEYRIYKNIH